MITTKVKCNEQWAAIEKTIYDAKGSEGILVPFPTVVHAWFMHVDAISSTLVFNISLYKTQGIEFFIFHLSSRTLPFHFDR